MTRLTLKHQPTTESWRWYVAYREDFGFIATQDPLRYVGALTIIRSFANRSQAYRVARVFNHSLIDAEDLIVTRLVDEHSIVEYRKIQAETAYWREKLNEQKAREYAEQAQRHRDPDQRPRARTKKRTRTH